MHSSRLLSKQRGSVAISYLAMLIPMIIAAASTIVIGYQVLLSNRAMQAVDTASLACEFRGEYDRSVAQGYLDYYKPKIDKVTATLGASSGCKVELGYSYSSIFTSLTFSDASYVAGVTASQKVYVTEVTDSDPIELVLVLDISGSMMGALDELKSILNRGLTTLRSQQANVAGQDQIKVSIVPFSNGVSVTDAPWLNSGGTVCVDATVNSGGSFSPANTVANLDVTHDQAPVTTSSSSSDCSFTSVILPLTSNLNDVVDSVNRLQTIGSTASYQGLLWGLRQLTPNWQSAWRVGPNRNQDNVQRKLVLMTDGMDDNSHLDELINAGLCTRAKALGIELNFIGFGVQSWRLEQFTRCAGSAGAVFSANNTQDLDDYFSQLLSIEYDTKFNFGNN